MIFPDIDIQSLDRVRGFQVNIITSAKSDEEGKKLLELLNMPFERTRS